MLKVKQEPNKTEDLCENKGLDAESWSQNQQVILEWALKQYPKTTEQRWEKIAEHIPGKTKVSGYNMVCLIDMFSCLSEYLGIEVHY